MKLQRNSGIVLSYRSDARTGIISTPCHVTQCDSREIDVFLGFFAQEEGKKACVNTLNTNVLLLKVWTYLVGVQLECIHGAKPQILGLSVFVHYHADIWVSGRDGGVSVSVLFWCGGWEGW